MQWCLCLLAVFYLVPGVYLGLTVMQIAQLHDLAAGDLLVAIAGYGAFVFNGWLLLDIALTLKDLER
ncbi:MAG: hypothetical protein EHM67_06000 [Hyphomicrobiaceae bacterium]|nr:MAG: hypothetical protein EHM67_06000 [Hyphomicrobiaceae bacterium]